MGFLEIFSGAQWSHPAGFTGLHNKAVLPPGTASRQQGAVSLGFRVLVVYQLLFMLKFSLKILSIML